MRIRIQKQYKRHANHYNLDIDPIGRNCTMQQMVHDLKIRGTISVDYKTVILNSPFRLYSLDYRNDYIDVTKFKISPPDIKRIKDYIEF